MKRESIPEWRELCTLDDAVTLLDEWRRHAIRLDAENTKLRWRLEYLESLLEHLDPFLPEALQNPQLRERYPEHYRAIAGGLPPPVPESTEADPFA